MELLNGALITASGWVWGPVTILLLVGTGIYLTIRLGLIQLFSFRHAIDIVRGKFDDPDDEGDVSHFQALSAALSATIGVGNIAGVATAIAAGGPGAVFWMWVTALVGMATKYASCLLALKYRVIHSDGTAGGGPMYFLEKGLGKKWLGTMFAVFAAVAAFGIGNMVQANSVADSLRNSMSVPTWVSGLVMAVLAGMVIVGGIKRIAGLASRLVPFMAVAYVLGATAILLLHIETIPQSLALIFKYAFTPTAAGGGFLGAVVAQTIRFGVARGIFSNESGLGSAPIAHAAAKTKEPVREGLVAMVGPFADTIIICSMTALVIISTVIAKPPPEGRGRPTDTAWSTPLTRSFESWPTEYVYDPATGYPRLNSDGKIEQRRLTGVPLTTTAFSWGLAKIGMDGVGEMIVSLGVVLFAFSTLVSWSYYGDRSISYLFGLRAVMPYRMIYVILIVVGAIIKLDLVWNLSDVANALMAVPNLVGLLALSGVVANETRGYLLRRQEGELP